MAIVAIYVLLTFGAFLLWLGLHKEDVWITIFSGMLFIFAGLNIFLNGFEELSQVYARALAIIVMFLGAYITTRATVDFVKENV